MFKKSRNIRKTSSLSFSMEQHMYSKEEFHAIIAYERSRCDREGSVFSVILVNSVLFKLLSKTAFLKFAKGLKKLLRDVDHIGWWESETIAVLLPSTDIEGARICSGKVERYLKSYKATQSVSVISYPNHWLECYQSSEVKELTNDNPLSYEKVFNPVCPAWKRAIDLTGALLGLLILAPVFVIVALYLKIVSPGRIFAVHNRVGLHGDEFMLYKFRTLQDSKQNENSGNNEVNFVQQDVLPVKEPQDKDVRYIPGGKILSKLCIDELPQLINVIMGNMSLVGPKPCIPEEKGNYLRLYPHRFDVVPGITGLSQVSGKRPLTLSQTARLDKVYGMNISWWTDIKIMLLTIPAIMKHSLESMNVPSRYIVTGEPIPDLRGTVQGR